MIGLALAEAPAEEAPGPDSDLCLTKRITGSQPVLFWINEGLHAFDLMVLKRHETHYPLTPFGAHSWTLGNADYAQQHRRKKKARHEHHHQSPTPDAGGKHNQHTSRDKGECGPEVWFEQNQQHRHSDNR